MGVGRGNKRVSGKCRSKKFGDHARAEFFLIIEQLIDDVEKGEIRGAEGLYGGESEELSLFGFEELSERRMSLNGGLVEGVGDDLEELSDGVVGAGNGMGEIDLKDDPKPNEGLALLEDDEFIPDRGVVDGARIVVGGVRILRVGDDGDVVGVVFVVGALAFEPFHIGALAGIGGVADDGEWFS